MKWRLNASETSYLFGRWRLEPLGTEAKLHVHDATGREVLIGVFRYPGMVKDLVEALEAAKKRDE